MRPSEPVARPGPAPVTVWAVLVAATGITLGLHEVLGAGDVALLAVLAVTFVKVWLVGRHFMELREAPAPLRRAFDAYVVVVPLMLAAIVLLA